MLLCCCTGWKANAQFVDGVSGLLCMPSADMDDDATFKLSNNFLNKAFLPSSGWNYNTFGYGFSITLWGRVEIAYDCVMFVGRWRPDYDQLGHRDKIMFNQDRHFAGRVAITRDGEWGQKWLPAIVVGISDPVTGSGGDYFDDNVGATSNGYFNRFYAAMSKSFDTPGGKLAGHLAYQYSRRTDGMPKGVCAGVTWEPIWLNKPDSFLSSFRVIAEYDARFFNFGVTASIWRDRFEFMAMLTDMRYPMAGLRFKCRLSK